MVVQRKQRNVKWLYITTSRDSYAPNDDASSLIYGDEWFSQNFTASSGYHATQITLKLDKMNSPTGNVTVTIHAVDGDNKPTGTALCTGTIAASAITDTALYAISFGNGAKLTGNTKYAIVVKATSADFINNIVWRRLATGAYAGGEAFTSTNAGVSWVGPQAYDHAFNIYGY